MILCIIFTSACVQEKDEGTYELNYHGTELLFNSNLDEAQNIPVLPDEATLKETLFGYEVVELSLTNYENSSEQSYYAKSYISFASKYAKLSIVGWDYDMTDKVYYEIVPDEAMPNATVQDPAILLMGPAYTDHTYIEVDGNIVKVYAANLELRKGKYAQYTDFDLALDKIILVLAKD
jgi:hypothetical protein